MFPLDSQMLKRNQNVDCVYHKLKSALEFLFTCKVSLLQRRPMVILILNFKKKRALLC